MVSKNNLTKIELIKNLSNKKGFPIPFSKKLINDFLDILCVILKKNNLSIKNIGTFKVIEKNERPGRNPKTNEIITIYAQKSISFIGSKKLLKILNKK